MVNYIEVTKEEEEAMDALSQRSAEVLHNQPNITDIINNICAQLQLLTSVITQAQAQPMQVVQSEKSLQECVDAVLGQAGWVRDLIDKSVSDYIDEEVDWGDVIHDPVSSAVEYYFDHNFAIGDHIDLEDIVQTQVQDIMSNATVTFK